MSSGKTSMWTYRFGGRLAHFALGALAVMLVLAVLATANASADFGLSGFDVNIRKDFEGRLYEQAGGHPGNDVVTDIALNTHLTEEGGFAKIFGPQPTPDAPVKDILVDTPPGLMANTTAFSQCKLVDLLSIGGLESGGHCPESTQVGTLYVHNAGGVIRVGLFAMHPPFGMPARFGFNILGNIIFLDGAVRGQGPNLHVAVDSKNISEALPVWGFKVVFWATPADSSHDGDRCSAPPSSFLTNHYNVEPSLSPNLCDGSNGRGSEPRSVDSPRIPFLTMPTACPEPGVGDRFDIATDSWDEPGVFDTDYVFTHEPPAFPEPLGTTQVGAQNCDLVPSSPKLVIKPTTEDGDSPTGLDATLTVPTDGFLNPEGIAQSALKKAVVTLPEGLTLNPSQGAALGVCTKEDLARETAFSEPGSGCPASSKLGTVKVKSPALENEINGSIYVAQSDDVRTTEPGAENPFDSLIALYIVLQDPRNGIVIKLPGKVEGDPVTGQLTTTFDDLPQVPIESFNLHFREGQRSPLASPRTCGTYTTQAFFTPYSNPNITASSESSFEIKNGVGGASCAPGGAPPFAPKLIGGAENPNAGSHSPFYLRMSRQDGEQEITNFSADLPPGVSATLAGVAKCSDAELAHAAAATGIEEENHPSCPANSQIGRALAGYGVGTVLNYSPGKVYLAGPYHGTPVSIATIASAKVGPFDLGTVVVRSAFRVDPETAQVHVDSKGSDPIPHILRGFPLHLRDIRVYLDRPNFTINPTSCDRMSMAAILTGAGLKLGDAADDMPVSAPQSFQLANCGLLPFRPKLSFKLKGGTHRGDFPALHSVLRGREGDANLARAVVTLPHSEFLEQGHIGTVCTRVEFAANNCPPASVYGRVSAATPLLDQPLTGNVYLRSNGGERLLPDLVMALRGEIDVNAVGFVDSVHGGIRTTFATVPDTPVTKLVLNMRGGERGLFINSRNLCLRPARADVRFSGQNGKGAHLRPRMGTSCKGKGDRRRHPR